MKKIIYLIVLLMLTLTITVHAQSLASINTTNVTKNIKFSRKNPTPKKKETLEKNIDLSKKSQLLAIVLGIKKGENISLSELVIMLTLIFWALFEIQNVLRFVSIFRGKEETRWSITILFVLLISLTGAVKKMAEYIINFTIFGAIQWATGDLLLTILIITLVAIAITKVIKRTKEKSDIEQAENEGRNTGIVARLLKSMKPYLDDSKRPKK